MSLLEAYVSGMLTTVVLAVVASIAADWFAARAANAVRDAHAKALAISFRSRRR